MSKQAPIVIRIESNPWLLCVVRAALESALLSVYGMDSESAGRVVLAVDEAIANVMRHGYEGKAGRPIWLSVDSVTWQGQSALQLTIEDEAGNVDLSRIRSRPLGEVKPGGLGVCIIEQVMDAHEYSHRPGNVGVQLRMIKRLGTDTKTQGKTNHG